MDDAGDVTVVLQQQLAEEVRASVAAGDYRSDREAVEDAVRVWTALRRGSEPDLTVLKRAWNAGKASGVHGALDFDDLRREARARLGQATAAPNRAGA